MPVAISFNLKIRSSGRGAGGPESSAYHVSRGPAPSAPFSSLSLPSVLALVCAWAVLPAFVGSTHPACCDSDFRRKTDSCLKPVKHHLQRRCGLWRCQKETPPDDSANKLQTAGLLGFAVATPCVCSTTILLLWVQTARYTQ